MLTEQQGAQVRGGTVRLFHGQELQRLLQLYREEVCDGQDQDERSHEGPNGEDGTPLQP